MKKINAFFLAVLFLVLCSCATEEHTKNIIKNPNQMMSTFRITPSNSQINSTDTISISVPNVADATIYYEIAKGDDCKDPTTASAKFTGDFALSSKISDAQYGDRITLKILAVKDGYDDATTTYQWFYVGGTKPVPNGNAFLSSVTVSGATFSFSPDKYVYDIEVPNDISNVTIDYTKDDIAATVECSVYTLKNLPLSEGRTTLVSLTVTSSDGSTKKRYWLSIYRPGKDEPNVRSTNCYLSFLKVEGVSVVFDKTKTTYNVTLPAAVEKTKISYQTEDSKANAIVDGGAADVSVAQGATEVRKIIVTAEAGNKMEYTVSIYRQTDGPLSTDATLKSLSVTGGNLAFNSATTKYDVTIPADYTGAVSVAYETNHPAATVISNLPSLNNITSFPANVTISVTAEDKAAIMVYTINITKASNSVTLDNNANLSSITLSAGSLTPAFSTTTTEYTVDVENSVSSIEVTAIAESPKASVVVNLPGSNPLTAGSSTDFIITVVAEDGTNKDYKVTVTRAPDPNPVDPIDPVDPVVTEYYWTNKDGAVGKEKTISSFSDWSEDMKIVQGAANDDPRVFCGWSMHEVQTDAYALYAAYDDTNLYLMVELTNVQDIVAPQDNYPISDNGQYWNRGTPFFMAFETGKGVGGDGSMADGSFVWGSTVEFTSKKVDAMIVCHSNPSKGTPGVFYTDSNGKFSYDASLCKTFPGTGVEVTWDGGANKTQGILSSEIWGIKEVGTGQGRLASNILSDTYVNFNTLGHDKNLDLKWQMKVPLAALNITKSDITTKGIGVMFVLSDGGSGMDCLPWDKTMIDCAADPYSKDESTSAEKEDKDSVTVPFARIGKM